MRLFSIHTWTSDADHDNDLRRVMPDLDLRSIPGPIVDPLPRRTDAWVAFALEQIRPQIENDNEPVSVIGWSYGGIVAAEVARALHSEGRTIGVVAMIDSVRPRLHPQGFSESFWYYLWEASNIDNPDERWSRIRSGAWNVVKLVTKRWKKKVLPGQSLGPGDPVARAVHVSFLNYRGTAFPFTVDLFVAAASEARWREPSLGWSASFTHAWNLHRLPGDHRTLYREDHIGDLARELYRAFALQRGE